jgi:hypothetical protein
LVEQTSQRAQGLLDCWPAAIRDEPIAGLRLRIVDGNYLAGTQHRLLPLRTEGAAALPGMAVVLREHGSGLLSHLLTQEDAWTNERALGEPVLQWMQADDLLVADRNFCWADFLQGLVQRHAFFLIRHHRQTALTELTELKYVDTNASGDVYEQQVEVGPVEQRLQLRCILVRLFEPTQDGETEIRLLSNVPQELASAMLLAQTYLGRWTIEHSFQELTDQLHCEVDTLGYPKAALFGFSLAVCAYNLWVVLKGALAAAQGMGVVEKLSVYEMAQEIQQDSSGLTIALPPEFWQRFRTMTPTELTQTLVQIAQRLVWQKYEKTKRGPKKPPPEKSKGSRKRTHVSTARLLLQRSEIEQ